jgi:hypothetical protein
MVFIRTRSVSFKLKRRRTFSPPFKCDLGDDSTAGMPFFEKNIGIQLELSDPSGGCF